MKQKMKSFRCSVDGCHSRIIPSLTASKARYRYWKFLDTDIPYGELMSGIMVKSLGTMKATHFYGDVDNFNRVKQSRDIEFAYMGMRIYLKDKPGTIVGGNISNNIEVLFDGNDYSSNCHPHYEMSYWHEGICVRSYCDTVKEGASLNF